MRKTAVAFLSVLAIIGCGKKKSYDKITTTRVRPPVQENLPQRLIASDGLSLAPSGPEADYTQTCQTDLGQGDVCSSLTDSKKMLCIMKQRLFCKGPTAVLNLLNNLDGRLAEIENRSSGGEVACAKAAPIDVSSQLTFPGNTTFTHKLFCKDSSTTLGFGQENGTWYVREAKGVAGQLFSVSPDNVVDGYIWFPAQAGSSEFSPGILKIRSDRPNKKMEITGGGIGLGFCGMHFVSNASHIYLVSNPDGVGRSCDYNKDDVTDAQDWGEICVKSDDFTEVDLGACASLKSGKTMKTHARAEASNGSKVWAGAAPAPTGVTVQTVDIKNSLLEIFNKAADVSAIAEFKAESKD